MQNIAARDSRLQWWLFGFLFFAFALTSSGRVRVIDEVMSMYQTESLIERGSTAVPQAVGDAFFYGKFDLSGAPQAPYPPLQAIAAVPWYLVGRQVGASTPGVPANATTLVSDFFVVLSSAAFAALAAALAFGLFRHLGLAPTDALAGTLALAFGTPLFAYSAWYFSEPLALALTMSALTALFVTTGPLSDRRALAAGLALGALLWVRPTHGLLAMLAVASVTCLDEPRQRRLRVVARIAGIVAVFGLAYLARNAYLFGDALEFGYPETAEGGRRLNSFETPLSVGLTAFLFSPGKSIFLFAPAVPLGLAGAYRLRRTHPGLAVMMAAPLPALMLLYGTYTQYEGGYSFGPRYLVMGLWLACLGTAVVIRDGSPSRRRLFWLLCALGAAVNLLGLATSPLEDMVGGAYYDAQYNYRFDYNPFLGQGALLWQYLTDPAPAPIGRGFDRWFVFLSKGGVSTGWLAAVGLVMMTGLVTAGARINRLRQNSTSNPATGVNGSSSSVKSVASPDGSRIEPLFER